MFFCTHMNGLHQRIVFIGSGKLGFPEAALFAFALGCDSINVGREAMMAIGCIQAQRCHTNHCPTGVASNHPWLVRGVVFQFIGLTGVASYVRLHFALHPASVHVPTASDGLEQITRA